MAGLNRWDSSAWTNFSANCKRWSGSAWTDVASTKRWTGSAWQEIWRRAFTASVPSTKSGVSTTSVSVTVGPNGNDGFPPYTYTWSLSPDANTNASSSGSQATFSLKAGQTLGGGTCSCTVKDNILQTVVTNTCTVSLNSI